MMKRTRLTAIVTAVALALGGTSVMPAASEAAAPLSSIRQAPGFYRMHVGKFEVTALLDGTHAFPVTRLMVGAKPGEVDRLLTRQDLASPVEGMINAFLVNTGDHLILIDTGAGNLYGRDGGGLPDAIRASGYSPGQVDDIFITHLHEDHVGGLIKDGRVVYPNATVHVSNADYDFWTDNRNEADVGPLLKPFFPAVQGVLAPYIRAGRVAVFDGDKDLLPGLTPIADPGHTPGHTVYLLRNGHDAMLFCGDTVHVAAVQFPDPRVAIQYDWNATKAITGREQVFAQAAKNAWWIAAAHVSFPGIGHVAKDKGHSYRWIPANYTLNR